MPNFIFYSWQSDLPNATNRGLIEVALEQAAKVIRSDQKLVIDPVIDRDTANVPGAPDIGVTILEKIDRSTAFVADVSIVNQKSKFRSTPNPNVLIELGYALKALGWQRIILIANTAFGPPGLLPFDLRQKRVITYHSALADQTRKNGRDQLAAALERAIRSILETHEAGDPAKIDPNNFKLDQDPRFSRHRGSSLVKFPMKNDWGIFTFVTVPLSRVTITDERFRETFLDIRRRYSSFLNNSHMSPEIHPDGYTRRFRLDPGNREGTKDRAVVTCYRDGYVMTEGYIADLGDDAPAFNPGWFVYEVQRHLQLSKEVLADFQREVLLVVRLEELAKLGWEIYRLNYVQSRIQYAGYHDDIIIPINLDDVHGREKWDIVCQPAVEILRRVARIFGMGELPQEYWTKDGKMLYAGGTR